jgi:hypothetical protein
VRRDASAEILFFTGVRYERQDRQERQERQIAAAEEAGAMRPRAARRRRSSPDSQKSA